MSDSFSSLYSSECVNKWCQNDCVFIFRTDEAVIWIISLIYPVTVWSCMIDICIWGSSISEISVWGETVRYYWVESSMSDLYVRMQITVLLFSEYEKDCWIEEMCRIGEIWKIKNEKKIRGSDKKIFRWLIDWKRIFQQTEKWENRCNRHNIRIINK